MFKMLPDIMPHIANAECPSDLKTPFIVKDEHIMGAPKRIYSE